MGAKNACQVTEGTLKEAIVTIANKKFSLNPASITVGSNTYTIDISKLTILPDDAVPAPATVAQAVAPSNPSTEETEAVTAINNVVSGTPNGSPLLSSHGLETAAADAIAETTEGNQTVTTVTVGDSNGNAKTETVADVLDEANSKLPNSIKNSQELVVVVQPILNIKVDGVDTANGNTVLNLDVSATSQAIVTTKTIADNPSTITTSGQNPNAVNVGQPTPLKVDNDITLTIPVYNGFITDDNKDTIFAKHLKHASDMPCTGNIR